MKNIKVVLALAVVFGGAIYYVSSHKLFQNEASESSDETTVSNAGAAGVDAGERPQGLQYTQLTEFVGSLSPSQRDSILENQEVFNRMANQEALRQSFLDAAKASQFADNEKVKYALARQANDSLIKSYINHRLSVAGIPEGFPNEEQVLQYYENNKQAFSLSERLPVWQIFWPMDAGASKQEQAKLLKLAASISGRLRQHKITFEQAAMKYSQHTASRLQGGYMGMLKTADLRPDIKTKLLALKVGTVSKPIRGENSLHVFRHGALLPAEVLPLDQVQPQVAKALIQALQAQQRSKLNELVHAQFPVKLESGQTDAWRHKIASFYKQSDAKSSSQGEVKKSK